MVDWTAGPYGTRLFCSARADRSDWRTICAPRSFPASQNRLTRSTERRCALRAATSILAGISLSPDVKARLLTALGVETPARRIVDATEPLSRATPFVLRLERHGGKATISGNVPPTGARERLREEIAALGLEVSDAAAYADGAPQSFADLASFAVRRLAELDPATTTITDATLSRCRRGAQRGRLRQGARGAQDAAVRRGRHKGRGVAAARFALCVFRGVARRHSQPVRPPAER